MKARILFITDLHKMWKDMSTIKGSRQAAKAIQQDIIKCVNDYNVTHLVIAGDWYHRGYQSTACTYSDHFLDEMISKSVNGNVYLCRGNHLFLERDANPEMYVIQPCKDMPPAGDFTMPEEALFKSVPELRIGSVLISFFHYSKNNKNYVNTRDDDVSYHIGVYHDDYALPSWVREKEGYVTPSYNNILNDIYDNVDLAIHGHIHTRIEPFSIALNNGRNVAFLVPGSLGITQNKESMKHPSVNLPMIDIDDDNTVILRQIAFSTHLELLRFYKQQHQNEGFDVKRRSAADIHNMSLMSSTSVKSLPVYLTQRGLPPVYNKVLEATLKDEVSLADMARIFEGE